MVRAYHWSSEGYKLYTYVTFIHHLISPYSPIVRAFHWLSKGYKLYTYVTCAHNLSHTCMNVAQWLEHFTGHQKVAGCICM